MAEDTVPPEVREYLRAKGRRLGKEHGAKGAETTNAKLTTAKRQRAGKKAAAKLTPEARSERARKAAQKRWEEVRKRKESAGGEKV